MAIRVTVQMPGKAVENLTINSERENYTWLRMIAYLRCLSAGLFVDANADITEELQKFVDSAENKIQEARAQSDNLIALAMREKNDAVEELRRVRREVASSNTAALQLEIQRLRDENQRLIVARNIRGPAQVYPTTPTQPIRGTSPGSTGRVPTGREMPSEPNIDPNRPWMEID